MKKLTNLLIIISLTVISSACLAQNSQVRKIEDFSAIDANEGIDVELTMGKKNFVEVSADESIINDVITETKGNVLHIYMKGNNKIRNRKVIVKVTAESINKLDASSGSSIKTINLIDSETLNLSTSSGATLNIAYKAPNSSCQASSGASAHLKGLTKFFKAEASSGASINADELKAINAKLNVSSGASINVSVEEKLEADASSGGSIDYRGNPEMVDIEKSSGGSVHKK